MRRYWQPAALSEELEPDKPFPVQLFGEELILFRDDQGNPALIGRYCAHQGVDMIYGHVEKDGIRCLYHGWLFDPCGKVIVRDSWVEGGEKRMEVGQAAYPCVEAGGLIFTYMAPGEPPALPVDGLFASSSARFPPAKVLRADNYLHGIFRASEQPSDSARFVAPNLAVFESSTSSSESQVRWHVPVDDNSHAEFTLRHFGESVFTGEVQGAAREVLLKATREISAQPPDSPASDEKDR